MEFNKVFLVCFIFSSWILVETTISAKIEITCKDHSGSEQQWFVAYKLPKNSHSKDANIGNGQFYSFLLSNSNSEWISSDKSITDADSIVGRTLSPLYQKDGSMLSIAYNDQPPIGPTIDNDGHSKGVILANENGGIWLVHSVPHFPILGPVYSYPKPGLRNGQVFFCLTLNANQIDGIGRNLMYTRPNVFNYSMPDSLKEKFPTLTKFLVNNERIRSPPWYSLTYLNTATNDKNIYTTPLNIQVFTKGPKFQKEIYSEWIASQLQTSLNVQSWLNGPNALPSTCNSKYEVHNILLLNTNGTMLSSRNQDNWSTHSDHSKWAVAPENGDGWICIGDLNRMQHQLTRGGVVLCLKDVKLWNRFNDLVQTLQPCPRQNDINY